jgi:Rrf2 family protein
MLSRKAKYGLKALLILAAEHGQGPVGGADLADREGLPKKFLELILLELKRHQLVETRKGKGGGYSLRRPPQDISFGDIIRALDGPLAAVPCVSKTAYRRCEECIDERTCEVRKAMQQVRDASARILDNLSLADASRQVERERRTKTTKGVPRR